MAFQIGSPTRSSANTQTQAGPDLEEIQTEALGFQAIAGETKIRLLPSPWPANALPPPTSSLLSIASSKRLLAAAGPASVIIASTDSVRSAFATGDAAEGNIKSFTPQLTLNTSMRISQVAFSADDSYLVLSAEEGGGLAVYEVQNLLQGNTNSAFELQTNGAPLRSLLPNPTPEKAELFAMVTVNGELLIANLSSRQILSGPQGQMLKDGVSCASWSNRGKQLLAGLGDGSCFQLTPEGIGKAEIPVPPGLEGNQYVSILSWLENDVFLVGHTPTPGDDGEPLSTNFHLITRQTQPQTSFMYQKIPDPTPPFGMDRSPPHHFLQRLRNFPPNLQDLIVVASTSSSDVGLFTRSETALASDLPAEKITNVFTTTSMANDSRRAQLPMAEDITDTSPIGVAMDLSCTEKVPRPLPGEEIDESSGPLPAIMILNNEGVLASWWIVYAASVRQNTTYPGLVAAGGRQSLPLSQVPANKSPSTHSGYQQNNSAFGQSAFRGAPFTSVSPNKPSTPAFGTSESTSLNAAFGTSSTLGSQKSPWASAAATTTPQTGVAAFGTAGGLGQRVSPWGPPSSTGQTPGSIFGQSSGLGMRPGAAFSNTTGPGVFGSNPQTHDSASKMPPSGGFASFAKGSGSGFAAAAPQNQAGGLFGSTKPGTSFGTSMETDSVFGGSSKVDGMGLSNVIGGTEFTLGSTFKSDGTSVDDKPKQPGNIEHGFFGSEFNDGIEDLQKQPQTSHLKEMKMAEGDEASDHDASSGASPTVHEQSPAIAETTSPTFQHPNTAPPVSGGFFGTQAQSKVTPAEVQSSTPTTSSFPKSELISTTPIDTPKKPDENFDNTVEESPLAIKSEPQDETTSGIDEVIPDPPLPPDPTSKDTYSPGDTSQSSTSASKSTVDDAPLPPDFLVEKSQVFKQEPQEEVSLPAEDEDSGLDDEGSGVDVANEISSNTDPTQTPKVTPASSFGVSFERSPSAMFSQMAGQQRPLKSNQLFGEVGKSSVPLFPPPAKTQGSPRSPSPVRSHLSVASLRPDNSRSVSAPSAASKALSNRKAALSQNTKLSEPRLSVEDQRNHEQELLTAQRAQRQAEEEQDLSDKEDEKVREELATEVEATTILEPFLAHQDYVGNINKPGLPGQIEKVYRDINSMIDTIGLNARSLQAFMKGHDTIPSRDHSQQDLERNDWRLAEIDDLSRIESQIAQELAIGQVQSVPSKVDLCHELQRGLSKLQTKNSDIVRLVQVQSDPETRLTARSAPLSPEQSLSQHDLRKRFTNFQKILAEAESSVTMLRAALASCETTGKDGVYPQKPTVEAVMSTIMKMTKMVEKRSGDIDVLEAQMRKMRISSFTNGTPLAPSTPNKANKELKPSRDPQGGLRASVSERGSPWRGRNDMTQDEDRRFREKVRRRKIINATLKEAIQSRKPRIRTVEC